MKIKNLVSLIFLALALLVLVHQLVFWHVVFELEDVHHEGVILALIFGSLITFLLPIKER